MGVLLVWEHLPAQSIAFQYSACLIPILFLGCIEGASRTSQQRSAERIEPERMLVANYPLASITTGFVLCLFIGQMPWSQDNLMDVLSETYDPKYSEQRLVGSNDNRWLTQQIEHLRTPRNAELANATSTLPRVLATGRIASHFVGLPDVETVSQFWQRHKDLSKIDPKSASPLLRYDVIVLDFKENFQQLRQDSIRVREEAISLGFQVIHSSFDIQVLSRSL